MTAQIAYNGATFDAAVQDVSEGGARIVALRSLPGGAEIAVTFPGMKPIAAKVVRVDGRDCGICFAPSRLRAEELRDLVTAKAQAA